MNENTNWFGSQNSFNCLTTKPTAYHALPASGGHLVAMATYEPSAMAWNHYSLNSGDYQRTSRVSYRGRGGGGTQGLLLPSESSPPPPPPPPQGLLLPSESSPPQNFEHLCTILYGFMVLGGVLTNFHFSMQDKMVWLV